MLNRLGVLFFIGLSVLLAGCAHSPQQLNVKPQVLVELQPVARQAPVVVIVDDARSNKVLGTRGGIYPDSSTITLAASSFDNLRQQVEQGVRQLGFSVVPQGTPNANQLTVSLLELSYKSPKDGVYVTQADLAATFRAVAQANGQRYQGQYSASAQHRFGYAPNQQTNTRLVTEVMSDALNRVFKDASIIGILQR